MKEVCAVCVCVGVGGVGRAACVCEGVCVGWGVGVFFKNFLERGENPKNWGVREVPEGRAGAPYIGRAGRFLGAIFRPGG